LTPVILWRLPDDVSDEGRSVGGAVGRAMSGLVDRHPVMVALAFVLGQVAVGVLAFVGLPRLAPTMSELDQRFVATLISAVLVMLLIAALRWWRETGFNRPSAWRDLGLLVLPTALMVIPLAGGVNPAMLNMFGFLLVAQTLNALSEEGLFRGLVMHVLTGKGVVWSVGVGALLFGVLHLQRIGFGAPVDETLIQVLVSAANGFFWAVLRLRTNTIWASVFLHTFSNLFVALGRFPEALDVVVALGTPIILLAYGLYLLRSLRATGLATSSTSPAPTPR
jgi:membrane protease YdiL (CAAX protease family)